jgi:hypothetical protein
MPTVSKSDVCADRRFFGEKRTGGWRGTLDI